MADAAEYLERIRALPVPAEPVRVLNVCGGHERSIAEIGLRSLLPDWVQLLPGPGCPVCVCPEESIHQAIRIAIEHPVTLVAFGDMLRVPINVSRRKGTTNPPISLEGEDFSLPSPLRGEGLGERVQPCHSGPSATPSPTQRISFAQLIRFSGGKHACRNPSSAPLKGEGSKSPIPDTPPTLATARAQGADIRPIASPLEVIALARQLAPRPVVFFAAGFETTMAPVAAMLAEPDLPANLFVLLAGRRTWPAVEFLLQAGAASFEAMLAPGHVAAIMGANEWRFVAESHALPVSVAGFSADGLLAGLYTVLARRLKREAALDNAYPGVVKPDGNPQAQALLARAFEIEDAHWRGIGTIPASGYRLAPAHAARDASTHFPISATERHRAGEMPAGCDCAAVLLARKRPDQCRLYGSACTPEHPIGPCMVSDEGACHIWWAAGLRA